ncbi:hypothetical protein K466DRAFT_386109 [Polyporus arcularius HHB13444]|uniref:Zn(2)-C6 fungal-type domain-containing protein n=1 Tax=Polyporus arcularius HHB13444 TaxID=1314778 RepID=A0A5C3PKT7_9APHY|nr:hypothetical protein K466DRAFT_386109 [Polyporus arcularius HHB13444]
MSSVLYGPSRRAACNACAARKVKCEKLPAMYGCMRCLNINIRCEWPTEDMSCTGKRRKACDACQENRVRCLVDSSNFPTNTACPRCVERKLLCSFTQGTTPGSNNKGHQGATGTSSTEVASNMPVASASRDNVPPVSRASSNLDRSWWEVCLGSSQQ